MALGAPTRRRTRRRTSARTHDLDLEQAASASARARHGCAGRCGFLGGPDPRPAPIPAAATAMRARHAAPKRTVGSGFFMSAEVSTSRRERAMELGRLHLAQGATRCVGTHAPTDPRCRTPRARPRQDELSDPAVVEHVHEPGEAPGLGGQPRRHRQHVRQQHAVEAARELEVVVLRSGPPAQRAEVEQTTPRRAGGPISRCSMRSSGSSSLASARRSKAAAIAASAAGPSGVWVKLHLLESVRAGSRRRCRPADDLELVAGSSSIAGRMRSRCRPFRYSSSGWKFDVATMLTRLANNDSSSRCRIIASVTSATWKLRQTDRSEAPRAMRHEFVQRIGRALQVLQLAVHLAHELVEVQPRLAQQRHPR